MVVFPEFELNKKQKVLRQKIKSFVEEEIKSTDLTTLEWSEDPNDRIPWEIVEKGSELGLKDLTVPGEYGGLDASPLTLCMAVEELSFGDMGIAVIFDQTWKYARLIDKMAKDEVRDRFFNTFIDDSRHLLAITLTEPRNGSNYIIPYREMKFDTVAEKKGDKWVINGGKKFISNGADAKTYVVFAQTDSSVPATRGTTAFLVPREIDGIEIVKVHEKISQRLVNNATIRFDGLEVPEENVLGKVNEGLRQVGEILKGSHVEAAATTLGVARRAFEESFKYAQERKQGGKYIIDHQAVGFDFAQMATELQAARSLIWMCARAIEEQGDDYNYELGSMAKIFAADASVRICRQALEKYGGTGILLGCPIQKYLRDALSFLPSDGTQNAHKQKVINKLKESGRES